MGSRVLLTGTVLNVTPGALLFRKLLRLDLLRDPCYYPRTFCVRLIYTKSLNYDVIVTLETDLNDLKPFKSVSEVVIVLLS